MLSNRTGVSGTQKSRRVGTVKQSTLQGESVQAPKLAAALWREVTWLNCCYLLLKQVDVHSQRICLEKPSNAVSVLLWRIGHAVASGSALSGDIDAVFIPFKSTLGFSHCVFSQSLVSAALSPARFSMNCTFMRATSRGLSADVFESPGYQWPGVTLSSIGCGDKVSYPFLLNISLEYMLLCRPPETISQVSSTCQNEHLQSRVERFCCISMFLMHFTRLWYRPNHSHRQ